MISRSLAIVVLALALAPGCVVVPRPIHREAVEIVVWAALAAIEEPQPTPAVEPDVDDTPHPQAVPPKQPAKQAAPCTTGTCRSVIVR